MAEGMAEGMAEAKAEAIFTVLAARGFQVPADVRAKIADCDDLDQLDAWIRAAITIESPRALLDDTP